MPVMSRVAREKYSSELRTRFRKLMLAFKGRPLAYDSEGCGRGHWRTPADMCATTGSSLDIHLAVEDFKAILTEVKKL